MSGNLQNKQKQCLLKCIHIHLLFLFWKKEPSFFGAMSVLFYNLNIKQKLNSPLCSVFISTGIKATEKKTFITLITIMFMAL